MSDKVEEAPKKKGKLKKLLVLGVGLVVLVGGGVGAGLYAASAGLVGGGGHAEAEEKPSPKLVLKSEQKRGGEDDAKGGGGDAAEPTHEGKPVPEVAGGEKYASNYYAMEKEFTSNLQNSVHFIQVGVAVSTPYDDTVIERLKTNDIAVRSAILMALSDTSEEQVFNTEGKKQLQRKIAKAINDTLEQKEGFGGVSNVYFTNFVVQ